MGLDECIREVVEASANTITAEEARAMLSAFKEMGKGLDPATRVALGNSLLKDTAGLVAEHQMARVRAQVNEAITLERTATLLSEVQKAIAERGGKPSDGLLAALENWDHQVKSGRAEGLMQLNEVINQSPEVLATFHNNESLRAHVVQLLDGDLKHPLNAGLANLIGEQVNWANQNGSMLVNRPHAIFNGRMFDADKVRAVPARQFADDVLRESHGDLQRLLQDMDVRIAEGEEVEAAIYRHLEELHAKLSDGEGLYHLEAKRDHKHLMLQQGDGRVRKDSTFHIPYKDGQAFLRLFDKYSAGDMRFNLVREISSISRHNALTDVFGPNPTSVYEAVEADILLKSSPQERAAIKRHFAMPDPDASWQDKTRQYMKSFHDLGFKPKARHVFDHITGVADIPEDAVLGQVASGLQKTFGTLSLQQSLFAQFSDLAYYHAVMAKLNGPVQPFMDGAFGWLRRVNPGHEQQVLMNGLSGGILGHASSLELRMGLDAGRVPDLASLHKRHSLTDTMYTLSGMPMWEQGHKRQSALAISDFLGRASEMGWNDLDNGFSAGTRAFVQDMGLTAQDLSALKGMARQVDGLDGNYIMINQIEDRNTRIRVRAFMDRVMSAATPTPNAIQRATVTWGSRPGTFPGHLLRMLGQFKTFPLIVAQRLMPTIHRHDGMAGVLMTAALASVYGMGTVYAKNLVNNKTTNFEDPRTWVDAFMRGGAAHLYGDLLLSNYTPQRDLISNLAGPTMQPAQRFAQLASQSRDYWGESVYRSIMQEEMDSRSGAPVAAAVRAARDYIPFTGLPVVKGALDNMLFFHMYEFLDPGWIRRYERRLEKSGQEQIFPI